MVVAQVYAEKVGAKEHDDKQSAFQAEDALGEGVQGNVEYAVVICNGVNGTDKQLENEGEGPRMPYAGVEMQNRMIRRVGPAVHFAPLEATASERQSARDDVGLGDAQAKIETVTNN